MNHTVPHVIMDYWHSGLTVREVASKNEISVPDLYKILKEYDVAMKNKSYFDERRFEDLPQISQDLIKVCHEEGIIESKYFTTIFNLREESLNKALSLGRVVQSDEMGKITSEIEALRLNMNTMRSAMKTLEDEEKLLQEKRDFLEESMHELKEKFQLICSEIGDYINA